MNGSLNYGRSEYRYPCEEPDNTWERVSDCCNEYADYGRQAAQFEVSERDIEDLRRCIEDEEKDRDIFRYMANCAYGSEKNCFRECWQNEDEHCCRLKMEYYLITGERYITEGKNPHYGVTLSDVRQACIEETKDCERYRELSREAGSDGLRELYADLAVSEERNVKILRNIISCRMCNSNGRNGGLILR